ncbi:hypothetical protein HK099_007703 [Clydaea vesicula]|uniref:Major facilitator superfamily (MFS) profile domain-containing protein n=1 Tax=Clydaea vesicula TaxID=447962 RepID=A0AAD5U0X9_9FUNG|nr:hypothetical protein HK099_007703 [Clydaea vesicula]
MSSSEDTPLIPNNNGSEKLKKTSLFGFTPKPIMMIMIVVCDRMLGQDYAKFNNNTSTAIKPPKFTSCSSNTQVSGEATWWKMVFQLASSIPGMLTLPLIGLISDRYGRKLAFLFPAFGSLIQFLITIFVLVKKTSLWFLFLANFFHGLLGSLMVLEAISFAYIVDVTTSSPTNLFGQVEALMFLSFMFGPVLGGALVRLGNGVLLPYVVAAVISLFELFYIILILPESIHSKKSSKQQPQKPEQNSLLNEDEQTSTPSNVNKITLYNLCKNAKVELKSNLKVLLGRERRQYFTALKFKWDSLDLGQYILIIAVTRVIYMVVVLPVLIKVGNKYYADDELKNVKYQLNLSRCAILFHVISYIFNAFAANSYQFYLIGLVDGFQSIAMPLLRGLLSSSTSPKDQGKLFASVALFQQIVGIFTPIIFSNLFRLTNKEFPGAIFLASSGFFLLGFLLSLGIDSLKLRSFKEENIIVADELVNEFVEVME